MGAATNIIRGVINPLGALFGLPDPLLDAVLPAKTKTADQPAQQKGITNAEAQAKSNAESADRAKERLRKASLVNQPRSTLLNKDITERLLS